jgi:metallo-beta-lactamase family protein
MRYPQIDHHGAQHGVTGSCHHLHMDADHRLVVECGPFQGNETSADGRSGAGQNNVKFSLAAIPYLLAAGYKGPIFGSEPSAKLLPIVLEDAFKLGFIRDSKEIARYLKLVEQRLHPLPNNQWFFLLETSQLCARIRLQHAGHVLGSAYVEIDFTYLTTGENIRVVFSGDLDAPHASLLVPPKSPERADILALESTYGDRLHEDRASRRQRLEAVIEHALQDNDTGLIPAFSIGRTQELLYELEQIIHSKIQASANLPSPTANGRTTKGVAHRHTAHTRSPLATGERARASGTSRNTTAPLETNSPKLPVILYSPLATRFTEAYRRLKRYWNQEARQSLDAGRDPPSFENLIMIDSYADHIAVLNHLAQTARLASVIAGNGMCSGERIVNYLKALLHDPRHDVLFVGYQAQGIPGHVIQQRGPKGGYVYLDCERFDIRARVTSTGGYSAYADQKGIGGVRDVDAGVAKGDTGGAWR